MSIFDLPPPRALDFVDDATVIDRTLLTMKLCVPANWSDVTIERFADSRITCCDSYTWMMDPFSRRQCTDKRDFAHVTVHFPPTFAPPIIAKRFRR